jgi:hypothetical protein
MAGGGRGGEKNKDDIVYFCCRLYVTDSWALTGSGFMQIQETSCIKKTEQKNGYIYKTDGLERYGDERSGDERSGLKRSGYERSGDERSCLKRSGYESPGYERSGYERSIFVQL